VPRNKTKIWHGCSRKTCVAVDFLADAMHQRNHRKTNQQVQNHIQCYNCRTVWVWTRELPPEKTQWLWKYQGSLSKKNSALT
jgi:hypothetical protein